MPILVTRGMQIDLKHVFKNADGVAFDPVLPTVEIVHYNGTTEIIDLAEIAMTRIKEGHFVYPWTVPNSYPEDETAFVYFRGTDGANRTIHEMEVRVVPEDPGADSQELTVKFTKV